MRHLRAEFVLSAQEPDVRTNVVCPQLGISRKTGYQWLQVEKQADPAQGLVADAEHQPGPNRAWASGAEQRP